MSRLLLLLLCVMTPLLALHGYTLYSNYRAALAYADSAAITRSRAMAQEVAAVLVRAERVLELLAGREEMRPQTPEKCQALLRGMSRLDPLLGTIGLTDQQGQLACSALAFTQPTTFADMSWFQSASTREGAAFEAPVQSRLQPNAKLAVMALNVREPGVGGVGVVALSLDLSRLSEVLGAAATEPGSLVALVDEAGVVIARHPDAADWIGKHVSLDTLALRAKTPDTVLRVRSLDGVTRLVASTPVGRYKLRVVAGLAAETVEAPLRSALRRSLVVAALTLLLLGVLAVAGGRWLSRPLRSVIRTLRAQREGQPILRLPEDLPDEYRTVAQEFNRLADSREAAEVASLQAQRRAERMSDFYATLSGLHHVIARAGSPQELYEEVCLLCVKTQKARAAWIGVVMNHKAHSVACAGLEDSADGAGGDASIELEPERWDATRKCIQSGRPVVVNDYLAAAPTALWRDRALRNEVRSAGAFPFSPGEHVTGVLNLYFHETEVFDESLTAAVVELTRELSFALENMTRDAAQAQTDEALRKREHQLASIIDNASDAIFTVDTDRRVQVFNSAAAHLFRIKPEDAQGELLTRFLPDCAHPPEGALVHGVTRQLRAVRTDGVEFPAEISVSLAGEGRNAVATVVLRDLTRIRDAEAARAARQKAEAANLAKTQFISRMSHELRTPLNAVLGFSQLLQSSARDRLTDVERRQLDLVFLAGAQLRALIDDVLDVTRLEEGTLAMDLQDVELPQLLAECLRMSDADAMQRGVTLDADFDRAQRVIVRTDPMRLRQVLLNLLSNAIKYNKDDGKVVLGLVQLANRVEVTVADTGLGMSPQQLANIFQPFNRLGRERSDIQGTGIGMAICRQLVELLGGALTVESEAGHGTIVTLTLANIVTDPSALPSLPPANTLPAPLQMPVSEGVAGTVLYIEDNPVNALLVEQVLSRWPGVRCLGAADGAAGIQRALTDAPDLVLLDMQLPDMTGQEVLAQLLQHEKTRQLPVVALSASAMEVDIRSAMAAGAIEYWTKPIDFQPFLAGIERLLGAAKTGSRH